MDDYIKRAQAATVFKTFYGSSLRVMLEAIDEEHAADVRPVVRGEWVRTSDDFGEYCKCSNCGKEYYFGPLVQTNFCSNCGADMRGGGSNG